MKSASVYTLQGIGNSINAIRALIPLSEVFNLHVHVMPSSEKFFRELNFNGTIHSYDTRFSILKTSKPKLDIALTLSPTWRREFFGALSDRSQSKIILGGVLRVLTNLLTPSSSEWDRHIIHDIDRNYKLLDDMGINYNPSLDYYNYFLDKPTPSRQALVVHPTASSIHKYYPLEFWKEIVYNLSSDFDKVTFLCSTDKTETRFCHKLKKTLDSSRIEILEGANFRQVCEVVGSAKEFIGLDSSLSHLAALFKTPSTILWANANYNRIHPYSQLSKVYIAKENLNSGTYGYSKEAPKFYQRAKTSDVLDIVLNNKKESFSISGRFCGQVKFFSY